MINTENMIPCDDGLHLIQLDENISHYGWVFRKVEGGWPYSVRKATEHEMAHAKARQHLRAGVAQVASQYQPAEQHQGEPVAYEIDVSGYTKMLARNLDKAQKCADHYRAIGHTVVIRPLGYTHADPGEVEQAKAAHRKHAAELIASRGLLREDRDTLRADLETMRRKNNEYCEIEMSLRAQLAERNVLLRDLLTDDIAPRVAGRIEAALSASTEPSAPETMDVSDLGSDAKCQACYDVGAIIVDDATYETAPCTMCAEPSAPAECAICRDLGDQCMECEEVEFRKWAGRHFASADYRKTAAGVFIQDWMRHAYAAWCARAALTRKA